MSDPVSNADIEDVLSSIRRLVSEEPASQAARRPAPAAEVERFVLTPAFRVADAGEASQKEAELPDDGGSGDSEDTGTAEQSPQEPKIENMPGALDLVSPVHDDDPLDAADDLTHMANPEPQISAAFDGGQEWTEPAKPQGDRPQEQADAALEQNAEEVQFVHDPQDQQTLEQRIAELEAAIEMSPQEWEPDGSEDGSSDETRPLSFDAKTDGDNLAEAITQVSAEDTLEEPALEDALEAEQASEQGEEAQDAEAAFFHDIHDLKAAVSEPEETEMSGAAAIEREEDQQPVEARAEDSEADLAIVAPSEEAVEWQDIAAEDLSDTSDSSAENDERPDDDSAEALRAWQDSALDGGAVDEQAEPEEEISSKAEDATTAEQDSPQTDGDDEGGNFLADDEATLDEETLRQMVADIVREELQGVLGERITRNVRRLVRREIQRAMAMRDLE